MKKRKGIAELGVLFMTILIAGTIAGKGLIFSGGNPAGSATFAAVEALTAYSQMPHVKRDFRERKAIEEFGISPIHAKSLSNNDLLALIRDDEPGLSLGGNNGNFVGGYQYGVRVR